MRGHALTGGAVDGLKPLLSVAGLLVAGLLVAGLGGAEGGLLAMGLLSVAGLLGSGEGRLLVAGLLGSGEGRLLRIPRLRGGLLRVSLLWLPSGPRPLVVAHSYLLGLTW